MALPGLNSTGSRDLQERRPLEIKPSLCSRRVFFLDPRLRLSPTPSHDNAVLATVMSSGAWSLRDTETARELRQVAAAKRAARRKSAKSDGT